MELHRWASGGVLGASLHGLWRLAGIGESFLKRDAASRPRKITGYCSCSGTTKRQTCKPRPQHFSRHKTLFPPLPRILPVPKCFSHDLHYSIYSPSLHFNPAPASGLQTRLSSRWRHGPVVRPITPTLVLSGPAYLTFASHLHLAADGRQQLRDCATFLYPCAIESNQHIYPY